jgi:hypothetical protein
MDYSILPFAHVAHPRFAVRRVQSRLVGLLLMLMMAGCATPPVQELQGYSQAFEEVRTTTYILIDDYERAVEAVQSPPAVRTEAEDVFDPLLFMRPTALSDTDMRRRAIDAVVEYNEAMLALARGSSIEAVKHTLAPLKTFLILAGPQIAASAPFVEGLMVRALKARDNAEFIRAFEEATITVTEGGVDCSGAAEHCRPIIEGIIEHLALDTALYYDARRGFVNQELSEIAQEFSDSSMPIAGYGQRFARPSGDTELGRHLLHLESEYHDLSRRITPDADSVRLISGAGTQAADATTLAAIDALMVPLRDLAERALVARGSLQSYYDALAAYVRLLQRTIDLLHQTQAAAERPRDAFAIAEILGEIGMDVERDGIDAREALLRAISAFRQPATH